VALYRKTVRAFKARRTQHVQRRSLHGE